MFLPTTRKCHLRTCFCTGARIARPVYPQPRFRKTRIRTHVAERVALCVHQYVFVRVRKDDGDVDVGYASVSMVTVDVGPGPYAFNPTSMMMCGGSRGVVEEGAGRRRIKSSKSFYLSLLPSPPSSSLAFAAFLLYLFYPNHEQLRVAFSRSSCSFDKKS